MFRYSSEITGTIMVQCIPILRPIIREIQTSRNASRRLESTSYGHSGKLASATLDGKAEPHFALDKHNGTNIALCQIAEEPAESRTSRSLCASSMAEVDDRQHTAASVDTWLYFDDEDSDLERHAHSRNFSQSQRPGSFDFSMSADSDAVPTRGLSFPRH